MSAPTPTPSRVLKRKAEYCETESTETCQPSALRMAIVTMLGTTLLAMFYSAYDPACVATATSKIPREFSSSNNTSWYGIAYSTSTCSMILSHGILCPYVEMKSIFMTALVMFTAGSVICATVSSSTCFIVGRALFGLGNARFLSGCNAIIHDIAMSRWSHAYSIRVPALEWITLLVTLFTGAVLALMTNFPWRTCYYVVIPCTAISMVDTFFFMEFSERKAHLSLAEKIKCLWLDPPGRVMVVFIPLIGCFSLALHSVGELAASGYCKVD